MMTKLSGAPEELLLQLEKQYQLRLDATIVRSIVSDYQDPESHADEIKRQLDFLAESEDKSNSDEGRENRSSAPCLTVSSPTTDGEPSMQNTASASSVAAAALSNTSTSNWYGNRDMYYDDGDEDEDVVVDRLREMFPKEDVLSINLAAKQSKGVFAKAVDNLLNRVFIRDNIEDDDFSTEIPKSVDGFAEARTLPSRKKRAKRRKNANTDPSPLSTSSMVPHYTPVDAQQLLLSPDKKGRTPTQAPTFVSAQSLREARTANFDKAAQYYARARSDPLMGAAAGYYSQVARDQNEAYKIASAAEADALVASTSTRTSIDLHGVSVDAGRRIALEKVREWWDSLGEAKAERGIALQRAIGDGFDVVTGLGMHSTNGRAVLGPSVFVALERDGWKCEAANGVVTVTGRRCKR